MDDLATIIFMAVLVIFSAYFSATETAFSTLNRARVKADADRGDKRAADVLRLAGQYDKLLSTLLIGNNIVNIALSSIGTVLFKMCIRDRTTTTPAASSAASTATSCCRSCL